MVIVDRMRTCSMMTISMAAIMTGKTLPSAVLALAASSIDAAHFDAIAGRKGRDQRLKRLHDLLGDLRRLGRLVDIRADRDDRRAIAALQDRLFQTDFGMADLIERNLAAVPAHQREICQTRRIEPLFAGAACHDGDIADVLADLRDGDAGEEKLQLLAYLGWREADQSSADPGPGRSEARACDCPSRGWPAGRRGRSA